MSIKEKFDITDETDFIDVELDTDNKLFVDPFLIYISKDEMSISCSNKIVGYFSKLLKYAQLGDRGNGYKLVRYLQENNEVRFGYSSGRPAGRGFGINKGKELFDDLCHSKAVSTGLVSDIFDASIMIENIGADKISDLTINIILCELIDYTQKQCILHNIPMEEIKMIRPVWNSELEKWEKNQVVVLPVHDGKPIILIPKNFARAHLVYTYGRYYNLEMIPQYEKVVASDPSSGLVKILKRGIVPSRTKIRAEYPCNRCRVIEHIENNPDNYNEYKRRQLSYVENESV